MTLSLCLSVIGETLAASSFSLFRLLYRRLLILFDSFSFSISFFFSLSSLFPNFLSLYCIRDFAFQWYSDIKDLCTQNKQAKSGIPREKLNLVLEKMCVHECL